MAGDGSESQRSRAPLAEIGLEKRKVMFVSRRCAQGAGGWRDIYGYPLGDKEMAQEQCTTHLFGRRRRCKELPNGEVALEVDFRVGRSARKPQCASQIMQAPARDSPKKEKKSGIGISRGGSNRAKVVD